MTSRGMLVVFMLVSMNQTIAGQSPTTHPAVVSSEFIYESAPYPQCHASTIVEIKPGELAAAWFGGTRERNPDVCIWVARRANDKWQEAVQAADGVQPDGAARL